MTDLKRVYFLSQLAEPGRIEPGNFDDAPGGEDEVHWFRLMLERVGVLDKIDLRGIHVAHGGSLPEFDMVDGVFLGGSYHMVSEDRPWQRDLRAWLGAYRGTGKPLMGICGGHQQMASILGGRVGDIDGEPMAASLPVTVTDEGREHFLFHDMDAAPWFHFGNFQHVQEAPRGATVLATRPEMPAMALDYGGNWVSVQFHPEADHEIFACSWRSSNPEFMQNYVALPEAPRMLTNFLFAMNLLSD